MVHLNLAHRIAKKIKDKGSIGVIEEASVNQEESKISQTESRVILEADLTASIARKTEKFRKKEEAKEIFINESYTPAKIEKKLSKDITFFNFLYENFVQEPLKEDFKILLESVFNDVIKLYNETDTTPRLVSLSLDTSAELSEAAILDIYKNKLNSNIKKMYTKPLLEGKILDIYEDTIKELTKKLIQESEDHSDIDIEGIKIYAPFEETVYQTIKEVLIPEAAEKPITRFIEEASEEYYTFVEESAADILQKIEKKIKVMASLISPNLFNKVVEADGVNAPKFTGITIVVDKNFNDPTEPEVCPEKVASMDPVAATEMAAEDAAEELETEVGGDLVGVEERVRSEMDLANSPEDYESSEMEEEAEESAEEETAEHPEQPGAVEVDLEMLPEDLNSDSGTPTNDSDIVLSGEGQDEGVVDTSQTILPGGVSPEKNTEDETIVIDELKSKKEVDSDDTEFVEDELDEKKWLEEED